MFGAFADATGGGFGPGDDGGAAALGAVEFRLLWALRRLAVMEPLGVARCQAVHVALQREFGEAGLGIEHLLRCWLVGLARVAARRIAVGAPGCPLVTGDELVLLRVLRAPANADAEAALERLAGNAAAASLLPLFVAAADLIAGYGLRPGLQN